MATSAAKSMTSTNIAGLLVLLVAMMASSADATLVLKNGCTVPITVTVQTQVPPLLAVKLSLVADAGATASLLQSILGGSLQLVELKVGVKVYVLPLALITNLTGALGLLTELSVTSDAAPCGHGKYSVLVTAIVNLKPVTATICLSV